MGAHAAGMTVTRRPGPVLSPAHRHNLLHPRFPRARSLAEEDIAVLFAAGYRVTVADLTVLTYEPTARVDALIESLPRADTGSFSGGSARRRRRRTRRPSRERARELFAARPQHYARATVTATDPTGQQVRFTLEQGRFPARWHHVARNRLVPVDILDLVVHTLTSWGEDLEPTDARGRFGRGVLDTLSS